MKAFMFSNYLFRTPILSRPNVNLCKSIQVGFAILDLSKRQHLASTLSKITTTLTDTDNFCVAVKYPNVYGEMTTLKDWFDFSQYPKDHPLFDKTNRKLVRKFKDELN